MVTLFVALLCALQQVQVEATVDRERVDVGESVLLTITVEATSSEPVQILNPSLVGLELLGTTDQSDVSIREGVATRILTRVLRLRATSAGTARVGATTVYVGESVAEANPVEIVVNAVDDPGAETLAPHVRELVERHIPPQMGADEVYVEVLTSTDSVVLGEQLDLAVVAWFPQHIRAQLRTPPTLRPPELQGAWTYSQGVPHAVDMRRRIRNSLYHVYVHAVVVFPLTPGTLNIGPATVSYSLPMSYSFLSREVRHEPQSDTVSVFVAEQPLEARPSIFDGAAGTGLRLTVHAAPIEISLGDATVVTAVLQGEGNIALWPEPKIRWPGGARAYPEGIDVDIIPDADRVTGSKTFRYLLVPDSAGTQHIGEVTYAYYDLEERRYVVLRTPELTILAEAATTSAAEPPVETRVLMPAGKRGTLERLFAAIPFWGWLLVLTLPPLFAGIALVLPRLLETNTAPGRRPDSTLDRLENEFRDALRELVGDAKGAGAGDIAAALRAAGLDAPIAAHAARLRERLWQTRYGPDSGIDPEELAAELGEMLRALAGNIPRSSNRGTVGLALLLGILAAAPSSVNCQTPERLYDAGALRAAADSFVARTHTEPWAVAHWYNLGAAYERAGDTQRARRAWVRALRLAPRDGRVREALHELPDLDSTSERLLATSPITPFEAFFAAALLWVLAWIAVAMRKEKWAAGSACLLALAFAGYGKHLTETYGSPIAIVATDETTLRAAPYGPAQVQRLLDEGMALTIVRATGSWILVERGVDKGWLLREEVIALQ